MSELNIVHLYSSLQTIYKGMFDLHVSQRRYSQIKKTIWLKTSKLLSSIKVRYNYLKRYRKIMQNIVY